METISAFSELISHPDRTLHKHLSECNSISKRLLEMKYISNDFFEMDLLESMRHLLVYFHDFGKATDYFQFKIIIAIEAVLAEKGDFNTEKYQNILRFYEKMQNYIADFNALKRLYAENELRTIDEQLGNHAMIGAYFVVNVFETDDMMLKLILCKIIRRHHGNLNNFWETVNKQKQEKRPQIYLPERNVKLLEQQLERLNFPFYQAILDKVGYTVDKSEWLLLKKRFTNQNKVLDMRDDFESLEEKIRIKYFFLQHFLFSLLLSADKGDMMLSETMKQTLDFIPVNELPINIISDFKIKKHGSVFKKPIDKTREEAYQTIQEKCQENRHKSFFSITLPTGLGKTYAAYNVAVILQNAYKEKTGQTPRIVYVLPFTSIIDQNEAILREILEKSDIKNIETRLSKNHYLSNYNDKYDETELNKDEPEYLADGWEHDIIVTTFVQFLEGIFTDKNRLLRKFHNMTNAIIILDEVQNIPPQYFKAIELVFRKMNDYFGTKFVFVTATQPILFSEQEDVLELANAQKYFENLDRIILDQSLLQTYNYGKIHFDTFMEILITDIETQAEKSFLIICNTIKTSQKIHQLLTEAFGETLFLSSEILPIFRKITIWKIKRAIKRQIVVSTQVVEAGVDIDLDIVYRDFAPMDCINQSAGRCNRNGIKGAGIVKLFNLGDAPSVYKGGITLLKTQKILESRAAQILEKDLFVLNKEYAKEVHNSIAKDNDISLRIIKAMHDLQTEDIADEFELIAQDFRHYNVFIPFRTKAKKIWKEYIKIIVETKDDFERKRKIKQIKPKILQYVTRFPKDISKYQPKNPESFLIYEKNWEQYYDLKTGFIHIDPSSVNY